jgi:hypothetical protein
MGKTRIQPFEGSFVTDASAGYDDRPTLVAQFGQSAEVRFDLPRNKPKFLGL